MEVHQLTMPFVLLLLSVSILPSSAQLLPAGPQPQTFNEPEACAAGSQFYQPGNLSCLTCGLNQQTSSDGKKTTIASLLVYRLQAKLLFLYVCFLVAMDTVDILNKAHCILTLQVSLARVRLATTVHWRAATCVLPVEMIE